MRPAARPSAGRRAVHLRRSPPIAIASPIALGSRRPRSRRGRGGGSGISARRAGIGDGLLGHQLDAACSRQARLISTSGSKSWRARAIHLGQLRADPSTPWSDISVRRARPSESRTVRAEPGWCADRRRGSSSSKPGRARRRRRSTRPSSGPRPLAAAQRPRAHAPHAFGLVGRVGQLHAAESPRQARTRTLPIGVLFVRLSRRPGLAGSSPAADGRQADPLEERPRSSSSTSIRGRSSPGDRRERDSTTIPMATASPCWKRSHHSPRRSRSHARRCDRSSGPRARRSLRVRRAKRSPPSARSSAQSIAPDAPWDRREDRVGVRAPPVPRRNPASRIDAVLDDLSQAAPKLAGG